MEKIILNYSKKLSKFLQSELENNYEIKNNKIVLSYHNKEDLFDIGIEFGKWLKLNY